MKALFHYVSLVFALVLFAVNGAYAQPANDDCANATTLTVGATCTPVSGTTVNATQSVAPILCNTLTAAAALDVWYQFVATAANLNVTVVGDASFDAVIDIRSGACNGTNFGCADVFAAGGTEVLALTGLSIGQTYLVRLYDYSGTATFTICVAPPPPPPANDNCAGALSVAVNPDLNCTSVTMGTVNAATASTGPTSSCGTYDDDVWFSFVATASTHLIELLNITGSTSDLTHQVLSSCGAATALVCSDPNTSTASALTPGQTYFIRVASWTSTAGQTSPLAYA